MKSHFGTIEMLGKVAGFGKMYASRFPAGSVARAALDSIDAALQTISTLGAVPERRGIRPGTTRRDTARQALRTALEAVYRTMLAVAIDSPGIEVNFRLPQTYRYDQAMIRAGQQFITHATPLKDAFVAHGLREDFLEGLKADIAELQQAINAQAQAKSERSATANRLKQTIDKALNALQRLDAIIPNMFGRDDDVMTAWTVVRQLPKLRMRKKTDASSGQTESPITPAVSSDPPTASPPA